MFVCSWVNPDETRPTKTFDDYLRQGHLSTPSTQALKQAGVDRVNTVGYCIGGTLLSARPRPHGGQGRQARSQSATFFAAQQDFAEAGDLLLFTDEHWLKTIEETDGRRPAASCPASHGRHLQRPARPTT